MIKTIITGAVISPGYEKSPALKFSEKGDAVRFRIGEKVYDPKEEGNHRWINLPVKAFGNLCDRIKKMKLQAGSAVNLLGRLDEDEWTDRDGESHHTMSVPCPISKYKGRTLGDMLTIDPGAIVWVANKQTVSPQAAAAAKLLCEYAQGQTTS